MPPTELDWLSHLAKLTALSRRNGLEIEPDLGVVLQEKGDAMRIPAPVVAPLIGESGGERIARVVHAYAGCSLTDRKSELGVLVARGIDEPEAVVAVKTNCAMFALGILKVVGCPHPLLSAPFKEGWAFGRFVQVGLDYKAWKHKEDGLPLIGSALWYRTPGENDDHVEFVTSVGGTLTSLTWGHGGGGRENNAITVEQGQIAANVGRPLFMWLDWQLLSLPDAVVVDNGDAIV